MRAPPLAVDSVCVAVTLAEFAAEILELSGLPVEEAIDDMRSVIVRHKASGGRPPR
jgi:hypothetical protein